VGDHFSSFNHFRVASGTFPGSYTRLRENIGKACHFSNSAYFKRHAPILVMMAVGNDRETAAELSQQIRFKHSVLEKVGTNK